MIQSNVFLEELYQKLENELLRNIGKRLGTGKGITSDGVLDWQVEKLGQLGQLHQDQLEVLAKYSGWTTNELKRFIQEHAIVQLATFEKSTEAVLEDSLLYQVPGETIYKRLDALERNAEELDNLLRTKLLNGSESVYKDILTEASTNALMGTQTLQQALKQAVSGWAGKGIPVLTDSAGRTWSTEAYISMVVRNTQKDVGVKMQEDRFEEYGANLVEATAHVGSRPSHVTYQGRIYWMKKRVAGYRSLYQDTSYGQGYDGFVTGLNCGHRIYMTAPDIPHRPDLPNQDKEADAEIYKESQKQRYLERQIRRAKKELEFMRGMGADPSTLEEAEQQVRDRQGRMRAFIKESNRTRRYGREQIYTSDDFIPARKPLRDSLLKEKLTDMDRLKENEKKIQEATTNRADLTASQVETLSGLELKKRARDVYLDYYSRQLGTSGQTLEEKVNEKLLTKGKNELKSDIIELQNELRRK